MHISLSHIFWRIIFISVWLPSSIRAEFITWKGLGGDGVWGNPVNWSGGIVPGTTDDVLLDNSEIPGSYEVILPDGMIVLRTLRIHPAGGIHIELILPASNIQTPALTVTGPGYGLDLDAGAVFRNASGIASGESLQIADSLILRNGARYIHQTRGSHANRILKILSSAPGTEHGIFDFDVPRASYTVSISNRIYGDLELHARAFGAVVNYTGTGANPLQIRGNLRIGVNVSMSTDLSGVNGNIQVDGDFIQEGGSLNLAAGNGDHTILRIKGDLSQSSDATIGQTGTGHPLIELNGNRVQQVAMGGRISQIGFRMNNPMGCILNLPLDLSATLELIQGSLKSSAAALLILEPQATCVADTAVSASSYVDGPLRKVGLQAPDHFLFPVGTNGSQCWLELKDATGSFTVEYQAHDPLSFGAVLGPGIDHISRLEYWTVKADDPVNDQAKVELSFDAGRSGGVTDPLYLTVGSFHSGRWEEVGNTAVTGNSIHGSVVSASTDFQASMFTLASTRNLENPLPLTQIGLSIKEQSRDLIFNWTISGDDVPDYFELLEGTSGQIVEIARIPATARTADYRWVWHDYKGSGDHYYKIRMVSRSGVRYDGNPVLYRMPVQNEEVWIGSEPGTGSRLYFRTAHSGRWLYEIVSLTGERMKWGTLIVTEGTSNFDLMRGLLRNRVYIFRAMSELGRWYVLRFENN